MSSGRPTDPRLKIVALALVPFAVVLAMWAGPQLWANRWQAGEPYTGEATAAQSTSPDGRWILAAYWTDWAQATVVVYDSKRDRWFERHLDVVDPEQSASPDGSQRVEWDEAGVWIGGEHVRLP